MKNNLKQKLEQIASTMAVRETDIASFGQTTTGGRAYGRKGRLKSASLSKYLFKGGFKHVNNVRTLKKAYKRGGMDLFMQTAQHYS